MMIRHRCEDCKPLWWNFAVLTLLSISASSVQLSFLAVTIEDFAGEFMAS